MAVAEFRVVPVGTSPSLSAHVAEVVKVLDASGLPYKVNAMSTVVQGDVDQLFQVLKDCHKAVAGRVDRVFSSITIDERKGTERPLEARLKSVEEKIGKKLS